MKTQSSYNATPERQLQPGEFRVSRGEGNGNAPYQPGQIFHDPQINRYLLVRVAWSEYFSEDGLSFGVGDDRGHLYWAIVRYATPEEYMPVWEAEAREYKARWHRQAVMAAYARLFATEDGEYVTGKQPRQLTGEWIKVGGGFTIYGGGEEVLLETKRRYIWRVFRNGADGDDWSRNNTTAGIGYRFAATPERLAVLNDLRSL